MPLTADQWKAFIPVRVGDSTTIDSTNLDLIWLMHDDKKPVELQYNYALLEAIGLLLGANWREVDWTEDRLTTSKDGQRFDHLQRLAEGALKRIETLEEQMLAATGVSVGVLSTRVPVSSPVGYPDANSLIPVNPNYRPRRVQG